MVKALNRLLKNSIVIVSVIPAQAGIHLKTSQLGCPINTSGMTSLMKSGFFNSLLD